MSRGRNRIWIMAMIAIVAVMVVSWALLHERLLDTLHAWRTGYYFEWMPKGVIPAPGRPINSTGQVAVNVCEGESDGETGGEPYTKAALWSIDERRVRLLGSVPEGHDYSTAMAIGEDGSIVGGLNDKAGGFAWPRGGFIRREGADMVQITTPGVRATCWAKGVNGKGEVAGGVFENGIRGFRWSRDSGMTLLEPLPGREMTLVEGIDDAGRIVGSSGSTPVLWTDTTPRDLGLPPGYSEGTARAINSGGVILVACVPAGAWAGSGDHPYIWSEDLGYASLPIPGGHGEVVVFDLDDSGRVLLSAMRREDGERISFLVTQGEWNALPPARLGVSTSYHGFNNRGWLTGYVALERGPADDMRKCRGFIARP